MVRSPFRRLRPSSGAVLAAVALVAAFSVVPAFADPVVYTIPDMIPDWEGVLTTVTATLITVVVACFGFAIGWKIVKVTARMARRVIGGGGV